MYYFIGIKGSGMAPLATILYELGNEVAGSDIDKYIFIEDELRKRNIPIYSFNKDNIKDGYHVIIGNAFDESNEEVKAALENPNVKCTRYYDFLADFMEHYVSIAVAGTHGKTTTTALLGKIMQDARESVFVVGNIGTPYTSKALEMKPNSVTVAEISSFQLETIDEFAPKVSAILNITEDHLNRHHTMKEYIRVKELITKNQGTEDVCVLNYEDEVLRKFGEDIVPRVVYFSSERKLDQGIYLDGKKIILKDGEKEIEVVNTDDLKLLGKHNFENVMAAVAMAYYDGVAMDSIRKSICEFTAVAHRIEYVTEKNGVKYYNDSKGTNPDAAIKGIQAMNRPTLLIGGGYDKQSSYDEWIESFAGKVRYLVLIGQTKEKIKETAEKHGFHEIILCENLEEAVKVCAEKAQEGDAVLLSPACASWGQFDNYEQRGDMFKEYVRNL